MIVGPAMLMPTANVAPNAPTRAVSSAKIAASLAVPPRPPYSTGQVMHAQPSSPRNCCHTLATATQSSPSSGVKPWNRATSRTTPGCASHSQTSERKAASSGLSSKSIVEPSLGVLEAHREVLDSADEVAAETVGRTEPLDA